MTPEERKHAAEVMASDGPWQQRLTGKTEWTDVIYPVWNWQASDYRVKPQKIVRYVNMYRNTPGAMIPEFLNANHTRQNADNHCAERQRTECVRVEFDPGQFDE